MTNSNVELGRLEVPVRWGDQDAYGHLNNTVYFRFFEEARVNWLEQQGFGVRGQGESPVLIQCSATFLREINYPAILIVTTLTEAIGSTSFTLGHQILSQDQTTVHCQGTAKLVWVNRDTGKSAPLPLELRAILEKGLSSRTGS
ncbi:acyl-CoA thioesterase [Hahella ganghwensis]|uniref:acyl-CoA thioesterase n=1 Tax=Hahella ganghwensis TaxID=286420 RepID=UPI00037F5239|nr:thioesterase family protein [Hahella ganghwensis]